MIEKKNTPAKVKNCKTFKENQQNLIDSKNFQQKIKRNLIGSTFYAVPQKSLAKQKIKIPKLISSKDPKKKTKNKDLSLSNSIVNLYAHRLKINNLALIPNFHWQNQWKNLHMQYKSLYLREVVFSYFLKRKLLLNNFYFHKYHGGLRLVGNTFGFYNPKLPKLFRKFKKHKIKFGKILKKFKSKALFSSKITKYKRKFNPKKVIEKNLFNQPILMKEFFKEDQYLVKYNQLAEAVLNYTACSKVSISFTHYYLPKSYVLDEAENTFDRYKSIRNFWEGLQIIRIIVENKAITHVLARFICMSIRRNPKRAAFIIYIKRLIDWHFVATENLQIQGIRVEVKGRFNAKSRSKKYILSVGRVAKHEKISNVDFAFLEAYTIFGSLAIKVWVCPHIKENVTTTA